MELDFSKLTNVFNAMFKFPDQYQYMTNDIKEKNFFIILRYFSKRYPMLAKELNVKNGTDKCTGMDLLHYFMLQEMNKSSNANPQWWFWSKSSFEKAEKKLSREDELLMELLDIDCAEDLNDMKKLYPEVIESQKENVKYLIKIEKKK